MDYLNLFLSFIFLSLLIYNTYLVVKRRNEITVKGKDDFFTIAIILFLFMVIFPIKIDAGLIESFRNVVFYVLLFSTFSVKRGLGSKGVYKLFFILPWQTITSIKVSNASNNRVQFQFIGGKIKWNLFFNIVNAKKALDYSSLKVSDVLVEEKLAKRLK